MKTIVGIAAGIVLVSSAAFAGGNPEDYPGEALKAIHEHAMEQEAAPVVPDQYQIQEQVEREIFAKPQLKPALTDEPKEEIQIARVEAESECWAPFSWLAKQMGGECYRDSNFHNPSPVGYSYDREVTQETRVDKEKRSFRKSRKGFYKAVRYAKSLHKQGYKVRVGIRKGKIKVVGKKVTTFNVETLTKVRNDRNGGSSGGTMGDSNGMRGRGVDTGDGGADRF